MRIDSNRSTIRDNVYLEHSIRTKMNRTFEQTVHLSKHILLSLIYIYIHFSSRYLFHLYLHNELPLFLMDLSLSYYGAIVGCFFRAQEEERREKDISFLKTCVYIYLLFIYIVEYTSNWVLIFFYRTKNDIVLIDVCLC